MRGRKLKQTNLVMCRRTWHGDGQRRGEQMKECERGRWRRSGRGREEGDEEEDKSEDC